ncbi:ATP-binding protein [Verrucomicrobia bacterium]|nr:ATP-binding protein [Verrucomicrobiota bacterium]
MAKKIKNPPDAGRLIDGLSDTGYDLFSATADIIDNSIAAKATDINIEIELTEEGKRFVYIGDNGIGMDQEGLINAMRYGSDQRKDQKSLGKFGLGLKTASSSICRRFSLISKNKVRTELEKVTWDLDVVNANNSWDLLHEKNVSEEDQKRFEELCGKKTGTLVVWENCDRLLQADYEDPGGTKEQQAMKRRIKKLKDHCALVFHKFLNPKEKNFSNVNITMNWEPVEPWNPFIPHLAEMVMPPKATVLNIETSDGSEVEATIKAWILPHRQDYPNKEELDNAKIANNRQGLYIHREGRIIQHGGWLGMWGMEPHYPLIRVEFDFDYRLDEAFNVNVKKDTIVLDPGLREALQDILTPYYREAGLRYRRKQKSALRRGPNHTTSSQVIYSTENKQTAQIEQANEENQTAVVTNNVGRSIKIKAPVKNNVNPEEVSVNPIDSVENGILWEPLLISSTDVNHSTAVNISKEHDFYTKIYSRLVSDGYSLQGVDYLLWALSAAEIKNKNDEMQEIFEEFREDVSRNLRKLLKDIDLPIDTEDES